MRTITIIICLLFSSISLSAQDLYKATDGEISFFSEAPVENISAINKDVKALINAKNAEVAFIVTNVGFKFEKPLMEEHFNENYMDSDQYPKATFKGKIENFDFSKITEGISKHVVKGQLMIHGVVKEVSIVVMMSKSDGKLVLASQFSVDPNDYKIDIPSIVKEKIADKIEIKLDCKLDEKQ